MSRRDVLVTAMPALVALLAALTMVGCKEDPYCLTCGDGGVDAMPDAPRDATQDATEDAGDSGTDASDSGFVDGGCLEVELCNDRDDDCDGRVDEGIDTDTNPDHCGGCGMTCSPPHAFPSCEGGECMIESCDAEWLDLDGDPSNGCEYRCVPTADDDSVCDLRDNDCDGEVDEDVDLDNDTMNCGSCGRVCAFPHAEAMCVGGDCELGACEDGFHDNDGAPRNGCEYACTAADPPDETCNTVDDDCDGMIDEGDPGGGSECGMDVGACSKGTTECVGGAIVCTGAVEPDTEMCNGEDDDCDGTVDEGNPEGGSLCGESAGTCEQGRETCEGGSLVCMGEVGPETETCDGFDNDCDGTIDEGNPDGGASCGDDTGACTLGTMTCSGGVLVCMGGTGPTAETCNSMDDDCDGAVDEDFDLDNDVNNCGTCGNVCSYTNGFAACNSGSCELVSCESGFHDNDGDPSNGCEYACSIAGSEVCNGADDDCDGSTDEGLTPPSMFCNPNGVCAGTDATCTGSGGWVCMYGSEFEETETECDGLDNDCDGSVDESFPLVGTSCSNGIGECRETGVYECNTSEDGVVCNAPAAGTATNEVCDTVDNDCDGVVDERAPDPTVSSDDFIDLADIATVTVDRPGGGTMEIMQYEASKPDASSTAAGGVHDFACAKPDVVPWTNVTWTEAQAACCDLNADGTCPSGGEVGWRLCPAAEWQSACEGPSDSCNWSYASTCATSQPLVCNGREHDCDESADGDQDCLYTTGSSTFADCYTDWGAAGVVYDMSGNAKEWTATEADTGIYEIRGGAYTNVEAGRRCQFDFTVGQADFSHPNTGFRCCYY